MASVVGQIDGSIKKHSKNFQNMQNPPLMTGDPQSLILDLIVPPELHLVLGVTDKITVEMRKSIFGENTGVRFLESFYKKENISLCGKQGGKVEGNSTRNFLKSLDSLELELRKHSDEVFLQGLPYVRI